MMAVRVPSTSAFLSSFALQLYRPIWSSDLLGNNNFTPCCVPRSGCLSLARRHRSNGDFFSKSYLRKKRTQATAEHLGSASDPAKQNRSRYHPSEDIATSSLQNAGDAKLTPAETARTIVKVNDKATLMLTGVIGDGFHENIIWPDLPYVADEYGNVYLQVKNEEDILQTIMSENNYVQVIIGFDTMEMIKEMELSGLSEIDFGIEEIANGNDDSEDEDNDENEDMDADDSEEDWVTVVGDGDDGSDSDEALGDWAKLETMRSSHPVYFAQRLADVASDELVDWMEQPSAGLAIHGLLRSALTEECTDIQSHLPRHQPPDIDINQPENFDGGKPEDPENGNAVEESVNSSGDDSIWVEDSDKQVPRQASFYKLEMVRIQLVTAQGQQTDIEVEDYNQAVPDAIAHAASKIMTQLRDGGEKTTQALRAFCWRCWGIQAEEVNVIGVDSLGFDLRVCSGTQIQTLRVAFKTKATSECSAERQLNDILFPMFPSKPQRKKHPHQTET